VPSDRDDEFTPSAPGWYPDPWSATGTGERYFDGTRWGTTERPLGRHTTVEVAEPVAASPRRRRPSPTVVAVVLLVAVVVGWALLQNRRTHKSSNDAAPTTIAPNRPPASQEEQSSPLGTPAPVPTTGGQWEAMRHQPGAPDVPVAFDPCRPIHYVVNASGAPPDANALLQGVIADVSAATGLDFINDGATSEAPNKERDPYQPALYDRSRWAPVLVAWSDETSFPDLAGNIAGVGEPLAVYAKDNSLVYVSGQVVFDRVQLSRAKAPDRGAVRAIMLHEFGHLVGLDHVSDRNEIMFSEEQTKVRDYGVGDRRGLAALGTQSCHPDL